MTEHARVQSHPHRGSPAAIAASMARAFSGRRLMVGRSAVAHATAWFDWIDGHELPGPACRQGFAGHGTHAELLPTERVVTCRRCRRLRPELDDSGPNQTVLFPAEGTTL
ncbi:hypothetical protein [Bounagaea algeriensis]